MFLLVVLSSALTGKVIAVMGVVYAVLQAIKKAFPQIMGWSAVIVNVLFSAIGAVIVIPPEHWFSLDTLTTGLVALVSALGAAGIHGTVSKLTN